MININSNTKNQQNLSFKKGLIVNNVPIDSTQLARNLFGNNLPTKPQVTEATAINTFLNNLKNNEHFQNMLKMMPDGDKIEIISRKGIIDIELIINPKNYSKYNYKFTDITRQTVIKKTIGTIATNTKNRLMSIFKNFTDDCTNFLNEHLVKQTKNS